MGRGGRRKKFERGRKHKYFERVEKTFPPWLGNSASEIKRLPIWRRKRERGEFEEWGELTLSREAGKAFVIPVMKREFARVWLTTNFDWPRGLVLDGGQLSVRHGYCVDRAQKGRRSDGYYSPRSWSSFSVSRCVYTRNREWNAPLYPRSLEFPLLQAVINRPRNFVNSTVYIPWNGCTPKSKEIEVDFEYIYIYIYFLFVEKFPFEFLLSREMHERKKVRTFPFVRDLYNSRENSRSRSRKVVLFSNCDRPIKPINFYGLTMLNSMFENWGNGTEGERGIWNARLNLNRSTR